MSLSFPTYKVVTHQGLLIADGLCVAHNQLLGLTWATGAREAAFRWPGAKTLKDGGQSRPSTAHSFFPRWVKELVGWV